MKLQKLYKTVVILKDIYDLDDLFILGVLALIFLPHTLVTIVAVWLIYYSCEAWLSDDTKGNIIKLKKVWHDNKTPNTKESSKGTRNKTSQA